MTCVLTVGAFVSKVVFLMLIVVGVGELNPYIPNEVYSNYSSPFSKKRTSTSGFRAPGPRAGINAPTLCLGCRAVWVQGPPDLCNNCR